VDPCEEDGYNIGRDDGEMDNSAADLYCKFRTSVDEKKLQRSGRHVMSKKPGLSNNPRVSVFG